MLNIMKSKKLFLVTMMTLVFSQYTHAEVPEAKLEKEKSEPVESETARFIPPTGWRFASEQSLPKGVLLMVVGKGQHEFPPSINLGIDHYKGSLKDYLKVVKAINDAHGDDWKDLGKIQTEAGEASLSQLDTKMNWGDVRMMQVILIKKDNVYILTAAALKDEFPKFYKDFFKSMRSLSVK